MIPNFYKTGASDALKQMGLASLVGTTVGPVVGATMLDPSMSLAERMGRGVLMGNLSLVPMAGGTAVAGAPGGLAGMLAGGAAAEAIMGDLDPDPEAWWRQ